MSQPTKTQDPMQSLATMLRQALREEIRLAGILDVKPEAGLPLPSDLEAERRVLAAMLDGIAPPSWLEPGHFYLPLYGGLFVAFQTFSGHGRTPTVEHGLLHARKLGFRGDEIELEVRELALVPWHASHHVELDARRIRQLAVRRAMLKRLSILDVVLRSPDASAADIGSAFNLFVAASKDLADG